MTKELKSITKLCIYILYYKFAAMMTNSFHFKINIFLFSYIINNTINDLSPIGYTNKIPISRLKGAIV